MLEMGPDVKDDELNLKYDRHWLAVLKNTNHLLSVEKKNRLALAFSLLAVLCGKMGCESGFIGIDQFHFSVSEYGSRFMCQNCTSVLEVS